MTSSMDTLTLTFSLAEESVYIRAGIVGMVFAIRHLMAKSEGVLECSVEGSQVKVTCNRKGLEGLLAVFSEHVPKDKPKATCAPLKRWMGPLLFNLWHDAYNCVMVSSNARKKALTDPVKYVWPSLVSGKLTDIVGWQLPDFFSRDTENRKIRISPDLALASRFWPLVSFPSVVIRKKADGEKLESMGEVFSIPDVCDIETFLEDYLEVLRESNGDDPQAGNVPHFFRKNYPTGSVLTSPGESSLEISTRMMKTRDVPRSGVIGYTSLMLQMQQSSFEVRRQDYIPCRRDRISAYRACQPIRYVTFRKFCVDNVLQGHGGSTPWLYDLDAFFRSITVKDLAQNNWQADWRRLVNMDEDKLKQYIFEETYSQHSEDFMLRYVYRDVRNFLEQRSSMSPNSNRYKKQSDDAQQALYAVRQKRDPRAFADWYVGTIGSSGWDTWISPKDYDKTTATADQKANIKLKLRKARTFFIQTLLAQPSNARTLTMAALACSISQD